LPQHTILNNVTLLYSLQISLHINF